VVRDVHKGEMFTADNVRSIRPADGLHPRHLPDVVGQRAASDIERGTPMSWELVDRSSGGSFLTAGERTTKAHD